MSTTDPQRATGHDGLVPDALVSDVRRIAVLRANGLGDLMFSLPAFDALRAAYADAEVVLLGTDEHAELLAVRPSPVDHVERLPAWRGVRDDPADPADARRRDRFIERMREKRFDLALQLHGGGRHSNPLVRALGARVTAGPRTPDAAALDRWIPYAYWQHEVLRYLEVVALVGARPVGVVPRVNVTEDDLEASRVVDDDGRPLVVLHPGASDPRRRWPVTAFAELGEALARERDARVVITGVADECELAKSLAVTIPGATDVAGRLSLSALVGLLARSNLVVANDTGPYHLAQAVGAAAVGIFWVGNAINGGPVATRRSRMVPSFRTACPVCGTDCMTAGCAHDASFVADVPTADVLATATELLDHGRSTGRTAA